MQLVSRRLSAIIVGFWAESGLYRINALLDVSDSTKEVIDCVGHTGLIPRCTDID